MEPVRIVSASPTSLGGGPESWRSSDESALDARLSVRPEVLDTCWTPRRNLHPADEQPDDSGAETAGNQPASSGPGASSSGRHKRSLQHAASHPSARDYSAGDASSSVSRRRLEWRNSHRNYRSTPTTSASRDAHHSALNYETRRALRDYQQQHLHQQPSFESGAYAGRRVLPKRGGSMREANSSGKGGSGVCSADPSGVSGSNPVLSSTSGLIRCQMITSPATKRWRCHTVDCPCSNNVSASAVPQDLMDSSAVVHRHSFPSSGDVSVGQSSGHGQRHHHHRHHHRHHHHRDERTGHFSGYFTAITAMLLSFNRSVKSIPAKVTRNLLHGTKNIFVNSVTSLRSRLENT